MRGCRIRVSLQEFLKTIGIDNTSGIHLHSVCGAGEIGDYFYVYLISTVNTNMPEIDPLVEFPVAIIKHNTIVIIS